MNGSRNGSGSLRSAGRGRKPQQDLRGKRRNFVPFPARSQSGSVQFTEFTKIRKTGNGTIMAASAITRSASIEYVARRRFST